MDSDKAENAVLLDALNAHGQQFLASFSLSGVLGASSGRNGISRIRSNTARQSASGSTEEDEEWTGIQDNYDDFGSEELPSSDEEDNVVVFKNDRPKLNARERSRNGFMSAKVSKIRDEHDVVSSRDQRNKDEADDERTNAENDALLHRLIHTKLLSGSLNSELDLTAAQRRKALEGRVLELSGSARLGQGEKIIRQKEHNRAAKRVRDGLLQKQGERQKQKLERAKDVGNYHPSIKKLFKTDSTSRSRRRERGLGLGIGKFRGGLLHISQKDLPAAIGSRPQVGRETKLGRGRIRQC